MPNPERGYVAITLDKPRYLRYKSNSLKALEKELGIKITRLDTKNMGITEMIALLWAGLLHEIPDLTLEQAGDLLDETDMAEVMSKCGEALTLAFNRNGAQAEKNKVSGLSSTGTD
ncbi:hypothetical protein J31TS4_19180 [Paenibacillus sp. J31TS4]|uniref:hypothetical protein n=1 Tax=Paenibacillus sp. J31TS4 TaxID=2807195 RepID=UPI001B1D982E|nr:hypothetical protein [Paenibacillus sp. J31TS4]GIP38638.1 hypothetical protein J31TS4_19180 [Paenibacillus sp. J31TS4]